MITGGPPTCRWRTGQDTSGAPLRRMHLAVRVAPANGAAGSPAMECRSPRRYRRALQQTDDPATPDQRHLVAVHRAGAAEQRASLALLTRQLGDATPQFARSRLADLEALLGPTPVTP